MNARSLSIAALIVCIGAVARAGGLITLADYSTAHDADCKITHANTHATIELGIVAPVNPSFDSDGERAVTNISGFECRLTPHEGVTILAVNYPVPAINAGTDEEQAVGFSQPVPVVAGGKTVLATLEVSFGGDTSFPLPEELTSPCYLGYNTWIQISEISSPSIAGSVCFVDADDPADPLVAADHNPTHDMKFLLLQDPAVPTEPSTWGRIKATYR